jgi:alanine racemase
VTDALPVHRAVAQVDLGAVERNCSRLVAQLAEGTALCAVVKADGYGHGAEEVATAALRGGASWLAVASATEAWELRQEHRDVPILTMGALTPAELEVAIQAGSELTLWREGFLREVAERGAELGVRPRVHVELDTGMGRLGERDRDAAERLVRAAAEDENLELAGLCTHFATADEADATYFSEQLGRFRDFAEPLKAELGDLVVHAANSAAAIRDSASHFDMVRCGVAIYGLDPLHEDPAARGLEPALELRSYVADVKRFEAGASAGYGRRWTAPRDTLVGVIPLGYGDGVRRGLSNDADVLVGGCRYPLVGTVSMDTITVDLGPDSEIEPGAPAVLIGSQGEERILAEELAGRLDTINYEVTCAISSRVPRAYSE